MRLAAVQFDLAWRDPPTNLRRLDEEFLPVAAAAGAELIVLPEMFATGFSMDADLIAEPPEGPIATWMRSRAAQTGSWITGSVAVRDGGGPRNRLLFCAPDGGVQVYDKRHPFSYAGEDRSFVAGDDLPTVRVAGLRVTPQICYDLRFADDFWVAGPDTDLFVVVANWPETRRLHWQTLLRARAIENQCFVVGVNRVGSADGLEYAGDSAVIDPLGELIVSAAVSEQVLITDVDAGEVAATRARFPFLSDRRDDRRRTEGGLPTDANRIDP